MHVLINTDYEQQQHRKYVHDFNIFKGLMFPLKTANMVNETS